MIRQLLLQAVATLRTGFVGVLADPVQQIELGPVTPPDPGERPMLALTAGDLHFSQSVPDDQAGQPRPLEMRQAIPVNPVSPGGPYPLAQIPLDGSVSVRAVFMPNTVDEYSLPLLPGSDFTVDSVLVPNLILLADVSAAATLLVTYSYVGVATLREFEQGFSLDYYAMSDGQVGLHIGLAAAILQTRQADLLDNFNFGTPSSFSANGFTNLVTLRRINPIEMVRVPTDTLSDFRLRLQYNTVGSMRLSQSDIAAFGIITSIHSRGASGPGVQVLPNLG